MTPSDTYMAAHRALLALREPEPCEACQAARLAYETAHTAGVEAADAAWSVLPEDERRTMVAAYAAEVASDETLAAALVAASEAMTHGGGR